MVKIVHVDDIPRNWIKVMLIWLYNVLVPRRFKWIKVTMTSLYSRINER